VVPRTQKIFKNSKIDEKLIFQKKCQNDFFFHVKSFFLEKHQKLHILAKSDVSRLSFKKNIQKSIFSKNSLKNVRTRKFESGKKNIPLKIFEISLKKLLKKIFWKNIFFGQNFAYFKNDDFD
jgi:hypothetical protein